MEIWEGQILKKTLMMVCYGGGHVKILEPLYQVLKSEYSVKILALTSAAGYLESKNVPYITFRDFKHCFSPKVIEYGKKLFLDIKESNDVKVEESLYYLGCSYFDLVSDLGERDAIIRYKNEGRSVFYPENTVDKIISEVSPDILITTNAPRAERASLSAARKRGIPTLCINDGVWIEGATSGVLDIVNQNLADTICVLSKQVENRIAERRSDFRSKVIVTGTPVFDSIKSIKRQKKTSITTILFADCDLPGSLPQYPGIKADPTLGDRIRSKLNELAGMHNWIVIFRPHPSQTIDYSQYKNITVSDKRDSLHMLLAQSDIVITNISTVGIEGKAMGLGLVSIEGTVYNRFNSFYELGMSTPVFHEDDIYDAVKKEMQSLTGDFSLYEGLSVTNITKEIVKLLGSGD